MYRIQLDPGPWVQYVKRADNINLPLHEVSKKYQMESNLYATQLFEALQSQQQSLQSTAVAAVGSGGASTPSLSSLLSNSIELVVSAADGDSFGVSDVIVSALTTLDVDWGDGTTDTYEIASDTGFSHTFDIRPEPYTIRMTFSDISLVTEFFVSNNSANVTEVRGLQNLINLTDLEIDNNALTSIDVSGMSNLTRLDVSDCTIPQTEGAKSLTSVNVTGCTSLQSLYIDDSNLVELPDLSDCTSLVNLDVDQCDLTGSVDISYLTALEYVDFNNNTELTEVIISRNQPLGDGGNEIYFNGCALTQTSVDNILLELASGSVTNGYVQIDGGTNATPGLVGRESLFVLNERGWSFDITNGNHTELTLKNELLEEDICASSNVYYGYVVSGSWIEVGNKLYQNSDAWMPSEPGWYRLDGDGSIKFEVSGSQGEIISVDPCV